MSHGTIRIKLADVGLLLIRCMVGVVMSFHGSQKLFGVFGGSGIGGMIGYLQSKNVPLPTVSAWAAALAEFAGGLVLIAGVGVRAVVPFTVFTMLVAAFMSHGGAFDSQKGGMEYPLTLAVVMLGILLTGPGALTARRLGKLL